MTSGGAWDNYVEGMVKGCCANASERLGRQPSTAVVAGSEWTPAENTIDVHLHKYNACWLRLDSLHEAFQSLA